MLTRNDPDRLRRRIAPEALSSWWVALVALEATVVVVGLPFFLLFLLRS